MKYTRAELVGILNARYGMVEGQGEGAVMEIRVKFTPEFLDAMLGGVWEARDGTRSRLEAVYIDADGSCEPILVAEVTA